MGLRLGIFIEFAKLDLRPNHFLRPILRHFVARGHQCRICQLGRRLPGDLDAGLLHLDTTWQPLKLLQAIPHDLPLVNSRVYDISKRRYSELLVDFTDDYDGPVIVKTNTNMGGTPDVWRRKMRLARAKGAAAVPDIDKDFNCLPNPYRIHADKRAVPPELWRDPAWVVERFVPERDGADYVLRKWVFLGEANLFLVDRSPNPVVKAASSSRVSVDGDVPPELAARRRALGFDYGKFDYVMVDGKAVLLDANLTPGFSPDSADGRIDAYAQKMADGLIGWIRHRRGGS